MVDYTQASGHIVDAEGRRQYVDQDPMKGVQGTVLEAADHNQLRNELVYLIYKAGLDPSNDVLTQVYDAIKKIVDAAATSVDVGFTPIEQGGVGDQTTDKINIGNGPTGVSLYVNGRKIGEIAYTNTYLPLKGGTVQYLIAQDDITAGASLTPYGGTGPDGASVKGDVVHFSGLKALGYGKMAVKLQVTDAVQVGGDKTAARLFFTDYGGVEHVWYFGARNRVLDPSGCYLDALPRGAIIIWYGEKNAVPLGWVICDGTNGTPDLRDQVVVGAGNNPIGKRAGDWTSSASTNVQGWHGHGGNTLDHQLTVDEMPSHNHEFKYHNVDYEGHKGQAMSPLAQDNDKWPMHTEWAGGNRGHSHGLNWDGSHSHSVQVSTQQPSVYLHYIMKTGQ